MPNTFGPMRSTLVISNVASGIDSLSARSRRAVLEVVWNSAPPEGFTPSQIVGLAAPLGVAKSSVYEALKALLAEGFLHNVGTVHRTRYVPGERKP